MRFFSSTSILFRVLPAFLIVAAMAPAVAQVAPPSATPTEMAPSDFQTAPVVVDGKTLFIVRGISAYPAEKRARKIADEIRAAAADSKFPAGAVTLSETTEATRIMAGDRIIMHVVDADGHIEGVRRDVLAQAFVQRIVEAIGNYRHDRQPALLTRHALFALAATMALLIGVLGTRRLIRHSHAAFVARHKHRVRGIGIQSFQFIRPEQIWRALEGLVNLVEAAVLLIGLYVYLNYVLSLFPWTRGLANDLFVMIANPVQTMGWGFVAIIPDLVFLVILTVITRYALGLIHLFFDAIETKTITLREFDPAWAKPTYRLVRTVAIVFALVVAYPYIPGSESDAFKGVSLFIGVLISLGSSSLIGNIIAGYTLTYRRTFKNGDRVKIGQFLGDVEQSRLMATYLRTPKNELVVVPNSKIINEEVVNYSALVREKGLILHTTVGIGYETPWRQVEAMLLEAAARTPGVFREPQPYVLLKALDTFSVTYELNGYCDQPNIQGRLYAQLHRNILDLFNEHGVQIMTPAYEGDPDNAKVVPLDKFYAAPARPPGPEQAPDESGNPPFQQAS